MKPKKLVCGVGNNNADYAVTKEETVVVDGKRKRKRVWSCPYYLIWQSMISRCYSDKYQERNPTYKNCIVSDEWLTFSNFKAWVEKQDWQGKELDKDLLFEGNKIYSAETCVFVTRQVNGFVCNNGALRGKLLIGVSWNIPSGKLVAHCRNPFTKKGEHLGLFTCEREAHRVWLKRKLELAHELASIQEDPRVAKALIARYSDYQI